MGFQNKYFSKGEMDDIVGRGSLGIGKSVLISESFYLKHVYLFLLVLALFAGSSAVAQTPGLILKPATGAGAAILDPNGDGYVSKNTSQIGFQSDDVAESELPYVPLVKPDPIGDLSSGATGGFTDIVGTNLDGNNAVLTYLKGGNIYFRIRLSAYAANSKAYSILVDTDEKFGFTGPKADPNAKPGNAGFEVEIVLRTNFSVDVYNVDNLVKGIPIVKEGTYSYDSYCQKSLALSTNDDNPDYFYDFYLPVPSQIANSTGVRYIAVTSMSPSAVIGSNNLSDVGGIGLVSNLDQTFIDIVNTEAPTAAGQAVLTRSACPTINGPLSSGANKVSVTTTEAAGTTIKVSVYGNDGVTLLGSGTVITTSSPSTIDVPTTVVLATGNKVKAMATAPGKGASYDDCDIETISDAPCSTAPPTAISFSNSGKIDVTFPATPSGTIKVYNSDNSLWNSINFTTTSTTVQLTNGTPMTGNNKVPDGTYSASLVYNGCESTRLYACNGNMTTTPPSVGPPVLGTTQVIGTGVAGGYITVYIDDKQVATTTVLPAGTWSVSVPTLTACQKITATQSKVSANNADNGGCTSAPSTAIYLTRQAFAPLIVNSKGCFSTPPTSISGYSTEIGATIELYKTTSTTPIGSTIVPSSGIWTITTISPALQSGNTIQARVADGGCLTASAYSDPVTISTQTDISSYAITINTPTEKDASVSGTITGGSYPVTLNVYVDQAKVGSGINIASPGGSWTVSGLTLFDLALGSKVQVTLTGSGCESAFSTASSTVQCLPPANKTISTSNSIVCANSYGTIVVQASEPGVLYTPVAEDGTTVMGYAGMGNGTNLSLTTYALVANPTILKVKASKFPSTSCNVTMTGSVTFTLNPLPAAPTAPSPQIYCGTGTAPTLAGLAISVPTGINVIWYATATGGSFIPSTTQVVANTTYYAESESIATGCRSNTRTAILVQSGTPAAPAASINQTFCAGATVANLMATLSGPGNISWFAAPTGGTALSLGTFLENGKSYYAQTTQSGCVSSRTAVAVIVNPIPTITTTTPASICGPSTVTLGSTASAGIINWYDAATNGNKVGTGNSFTTPWISSTTTYYVEATYNGCTTDTRTAVVATVKTIPTITITTAPECTPDFLTYSVGVTVSGGAVTSTDGSVLNTNGNVWSVSNVPKGTNITLTVSLNGCTKTLSITAPDCGCEVVTSPISGGDKQYCSGNAIPSISATVGSGVTIDWYSAPSGGLPLLANAYSYTPSSAGTYYAEARNISTGCKSSMRTAIALTENPNPTIGSMTASACSGVGFTITPTNGINGIVPSGTTYSWPAPSGTGFTGGQAGSGAALISGTLSNNTSTVQTATYTVTPVSGGCTGTAFTVTVTINPKASVISVTGTTPLAMGTTAIYTANSVVLGGGNGTWSSSNASVATINASTGVVTAIAPGTSTITYTITGGCGGTVSASNVIAVVPTVSFTTASQSSVNESGSLILTVQLSAASSQPISVPFTLSGTATLGTDYTITSSPKVISAGNISATITIAINDDSEVEGNETVIVTMGLPTNADCGNITEFTGTITDNDVNPANDADGDGIINSVDADDDNDGILDTVEGSSDSDVDKIANQVDLDSDNDGIYDILEAGGTDADFNGRVDNFTDANGNGLTDSYDPVCNGTTKVTGQANSIYSYSTNVANPTLAVDADNLSYATLNSYDASIVVQFQSLVSSETAVTLKMYVGATVNIEQSVDATNFSNLVSYSSPNANNIFTYNLTSNANYLRITRKSNKDIFIYHITFPYTICNGNIGSLIPDYDSDNDGNKDRLELDSDNDGCKDVIEAGFTDANSDGKLDGTAVSPLGKVTGNINGYTMPVDAYLTTAYDYREKNPTAVGGAVFGSTTICSGSGSGTLTLSGYTGVIVKWQSSVSPFTSWTDIASTSTTYSAAIITETTKFRAMVITSACSYDFSAPATVTVRPIPTATISGTTSVCQNGTAPAITFTNPQALPITITYNINEFNQTTINVNANSTTSVTIPTSESGTFNYKLISVAYQDTPSCSKNISGTATVTVVASASSAAGPDMTACFASGAINIISGSNAGNNMGIIWSSSGTGNFSNATSLTLATYTPSQADITAGVVTLTLTAYGNSPCANAVSTKKLNIRLDGSWTGAVDRDWNNPGNWACNQLPTLTTNVTIASGLANYPIVSTNPKGMARDISIASGASVAVNGGILQIAKDISIAGSASVTVDGGTVQVAGNITNSGTFNAKQGTVEMTGSAAQTVGNNLFIDNTILNLTVNNPTGVTLLGPLNVTGVVKAMNGNLQSGGNLTLVSTVAQTALIDGSGTGNVLGNVNMQRYLPNSFGYKYFSSPFTSATVAELADDVVLEKTFPTFYKYDEDHSRDSLGNTVYYSGWTKYDETVNPLIPLYGYAANLGTGTDPKIVTMSGVVNNGNLSTTLYNHNRKYTKGFNLVGNPYPSPINWDATVGWTREKIDGFIYFFHASATDRYTGTYTSYVNGQSSGVGDNIIGAMQGFFVHVSYGTFPVTATLGVNNTVRVNNLNPVFKAAKIDPRPSLRLKAGFESKNPIYDATVIYFDEMAGNAFEQDKDALKLNNTDLQVPNIYTLSPEGRQLSINGLPMAVDSVSLIPVGITTYTSGWINLRAENVNDLSVFEQVIFQDALTGKSHDLRQSPDVRFYLDKGQYDRRFSLLFSKEPGIGNPIPEKLFTVVRSGNSVLVKVNLANSVKGNLKVTNMLGQTLLRKEVFEKETVEITQGTGVYIITLVSGKLSASEKILMRTDYE